MKLPEKKGERAVVWEAFERDAEGPTRVVVTSDGKGRWSMATESAYRADEDDPDGEVWTDGKRYAWDAPPGAMPAMLGRVMTTMALAVGGRPYLLIPDVKPPLPTFTSRGDNVIAKIKGNRCLIVANHGDAYTGEPIVSIRTNKALDAGEWIAVLKGLARALTAYNRAMEGDEG